MLYLPLPRFPLGSSSSKPSPLAPTTREAPAHEPQDASPGSPMTHLVGESWGERLWEESTSPSLRPSTRMGPGEPLREQTGLVRGPRGHTGRSPVLHLAGSCPPGTGARLQRPPAPGGGQGPRSRLRGEAKREARWRQHLGGSSSPGQARPAQGLPPRGRGVGGVLESSPGHGKSPP